MCCRQRCSGGLVCLRVCIGVPDAKPSGLCKALTNNSCRQVCWLDRNRWKVGGHAWADFSAAEVPQRHKVFGVSQPSQQILQNEPGTSKETERARLRVAGGAVQRTASFSCAVLGNGWFVTTRPRGCVHKGMGLVVRLLFSVTVTDARGPNLDRSCRATTMPPLRSMPAMMLT